jgi:predicted nucleic acid-binding protein
VAQSLCISKSAVCGQAAARLKAQLKLSYADCFAAALAQARKAALVTSDKDFQRAATALKILWV